MKANNKLTLAGRTEFEKIVSQEIIPLARKIHFICMATEKCGPLFSLFDEEATLYHTLEPLIQQQSK
jgi:hypothetical protein